MSDTKTRIMKNSDIIFRGRTFHVLFPEEIRPLLPMERQEMRASIREKGVEVPVVIDETDGVIDGINRLTIATELDLGAARVPFDLRAGLSPEEKLELCRRLNEMRRQLTPAEVETRKARRVKKCGELASQGMSSRSIAAEVGVDRMTVHADLRSAGEDSPPERPEKVRGQDAKQYPAKALPPEELDARAERILEQKKEGKTVSEIAKKEKVSRGTVARYAANGRRMGSKGSPRKQRLHAEANAAIAKRTAELRAVEVEAERADPDLAEAKAYLYVEGQYDAVEDLVDSLREEVEEFAVSNPLPGFNEVYLPEHVLDVLRRHRKQWQFFLGRLDGVIDLHRQTWGL